MLAAALERLDVVAAPAPTQVAPLEAVLSALRATQQALEATQAFTFGAEVTHPLPPFLNPPPSLKDASAVRSTLCDWPLQQDKHHRYLLKPQPRRHLSETWQQRRYESDSALCCFMNDVIILSSHALLVPLPQQPS